MQAIWNLARMWYFTGNEAYAQKAHDILLAWAKTQTTFVGMESNLELDDHTFFCGWSGHPARHVAQTDTGRHRRRAGAKHEQKNWVTRCGFEPLLQV